MVDDRDQENVIRLGRPKQIFIIYTIPIGQDTIDPQLKRQPTGRKAHFSIVLQLADIKSHHNEVSPRRLMWFVPDSFSKTLHEKIANTPAWIVTSSKTKTLSVALKKKLSPKRRVISIGND
jgi:hypothetical protein